jgi:uncharacterized membrane protein YhaH (DUF805 family)
MEMNLFEGRIGRGSYFLRLILVNFGIFAIMDTVLLQQRVGEESAWVALILVIPLIIYLITIIVRRLHDLDKSGWVLLAPLIPVFLLALGLLDFGYGLEGPCFVIIVILIFSLYLLIVKGTEGPNSFGLDPLTTTTNEEE